MEQPNNNNERSYNSNTQQTDVATIILTNNQGATGTQESYESQNSAARDVRSLGGSFGQIKPAHDTTILNSDSEDEDDLAYLTPLKKTRVHPPQSTTSTLTSKSGQSSSLEASPPSSSSGGGMSTCEKYLIEKQNSKKVLFAMLLGLKNGEPSFGDPDHNDSFFNLKGKSQWLPSKTEYVAEVQRRYAVLHPEKKEKACSSWMKKTLKQWLIDHPITDPKDVVFLLAEEEKFRNQIVASQEERQNQNQQLYSKESQPRTEWIGLMPWLRLAHVMIHDGVFQLYQEKDRWETRAGTDGRNSEQRPQQWFEKAEEVYNNEDTVFDTLLLPNLHTDFAQSYRLDKTNTPVTTAETIKKKAASARAEILCVIDKWERSGNGSGQRVEDDAEFGSIIRDGVQQWLRPGSSMDEPEFQDGDNRANFLGGRGSHILYMWELFDMNQMLQTAMSALPRHMGGDSDSAPKTLRGRPKKDADDSEKEYRSTQRKIGKSLDKLADATSSSVEIEIRAEMRLIRREIRECVDDEEKEELEEDLKALKKRLELLAQHQLQEDNEEL